MISSYWHSRKEAIEAGPAIYRFTPSCLPKKKNKAKKLGRCAAISAATAPVK